MRKITIVSTDRECSNNITCNSVIDVSDDPNGIYVRGKTVTDPGLLADIPRDDDETLVRLPRWMWENRSA